MDPITTMLIEAAISSGFKGLEGLFSGGSDKGQKPLGSFERMGAISPKTMLQQGHGLMQQLAGMGFANAARPISLPSSAAQPLPSFSGGPMRM